MELRRKTICFDLVLAKMVLHTFCFNEESGVITALAISFSAAHDASVLPQLPGSMKSVVTPRYFNYLRTVFAVNSGPLSDENILRSTPEYKQIE